MSEQSTSRSRSKKKAYPNSNVDELQETLGAILSRLSALEDSGRRASCSSETAASGTCAVIASPRAPGPHVAPPPESNASTVTASTLPDPTERLIGALSALTKVRSTHYYISNFDPSLHDIDSWCEEVEKARIINNWDDNECLARIGNCLKGDARSWLSDWITNDRTWSNFKTEFKPLCSRRIDIAGILYDVMSTNSNSYPTYAEYARRSLLRLNIVKGLSDDLTTAIVIRGITDAQIRATATNARLTTKDLVEFLSIYTKPNTSTSSVKYTQDKKLEHNFRKRGHSNMTTTSDLKCFSCQSTGHFQRSCPKRFKSNTPTAAVEPRTCSFCKKKGHDVSVCFAKQKSEQRNENMSTFTSS